MSVPHPPRRIARRLIAVAVTAVLLGGCGSGDDNGESVSTAASGGGGAAGSLDVVAKDFAFEPKDATAAAGDVKITLDNQGNAPHELVLVKTDAEPDALESSAGKASEEGALGEIEPTDGGASASKSFKLAAGRYVMFCNVDGHYGKGMYGTLTAE
jgi:uncharacterized cupredoxin-like copper-binding protein